jgi:enhancer of mRNA-decapping protein 3
MLFHVSTSELVMHSVLHLFTLNFLLHNFTDLPTVAVDLIVLALADELGSHLNQARYRAAAEWANENRAPVLALDPPPAGTPGVDTKFSLVSVLPLAHSLDNGKLYLCNLAFPQQVFKEVGIKYNSPFGPKFVIPLHPNDT